MFCINFNYIIDDFIISLFNIKKLSLKAIFLQIIVIRTEISIQIEKSFRLLKPLYQLFLTILYNYI